MAVDHSRLRQLFIDACDLSEPQQLALMEQQCADSPDLLAELKRLLRKDGTDRGILSDEDITAGVQLNIDTVFETDLPRTIGRYRVKCILGQGGMGVVYLAQQENPQRNVALKVIRSGIMSRELLRRFDLETAVLGRLQHSGIARIHEAGVYDDGSGGRPFFAMDYVDGPSLIEYARRHQLNVRDRLKMLIQVCNAVHHAHQRGVIHRDLKPGNILVTPDGQPQILDFGVARATDSDLQISTLQTGIGQLIGTLPYMSPEQVTGRGQDIDTRSDVYGLGVIAYELLTGKQPYDLKGRPIVTAAKVISEDEPSPLTAADRQFRGDLNTIVLKALAKEPDRRYQSAAALADDIQRFLNDQPVVARPATKLYQFRKFAKRNKALVAGIAVTLLVLVGGVIGTSLGMLRAQDEVNRTAAINEFMTGILVQANPTYGNANVKLVDVLRSSSADASERFRDHPRLEADVRILLGRAFKSLTLHEDAIMNHRRAYSIRKSEYGVSDPSTRKAGGDLVFALVNRNASECISVANECLEHTPPDELRSVQSLDFHRYIGIAHSRQGKYELAEKELRDVLKITRDSLGPDHVISIVTCASLARLLRNRAMFGSSEDRRANQDEAEELYRDAVWRSERVRGPDHSNTLKFTLNLADILRDKREYEEAEVLARHVLELTPPRFGADHEFCLRAYMNLAWIRFSQARYEEAADECVKSVEMGRRRADSDNVDVIALLADALPMIEAGGRYVEGENYARILLQSLGSGHGGKADKHRLYLARFLSATGKTEEAKQIFEEVVSSGVLESSKSLDCLYRLFIGEQQLLLGNRLEAASNFDQALSLRKQMDDNARPPIARIQAAINRAGINEDTNDD